MTGARSFVDYLQDLSESVKHGDILVMFAALYNKLKDSKLRQNRNDQGKDEQKQDAGPDTRPHAPLTALRA